jgi:hypothetical protein
MLIGFKIDGQKCFDFLNENDWIDLKNDLIVFKRVDYSFLLDVVVIDEKTKRRKRLLTKDSFISPFSLLTTTHPREKSETDNRPKNQEDLDIQIVMMISQNFGHQYLHPSEIILRLIPEQSKNETNLKLNHKKAHKLFSINWYNTLPVTFADDWVFLRDFCSSFLTDATQLNQQIDKVREDWCMNDEIDLLPEILDAYAMNFFKTKPHGLIKKYWIPLSTKTAVELIRSSIPERTTFLSSNADHKEFIVPNDVFYDSGRLYKIGS